MAVYRKKISSLDSVKEIIRGEGSYSDKGIIVKMKSFHPLFFEQNGFKNYGFFEKGNYESSIKYIEDILEKHEEIYKSKCVIRGKYKSSGLRNDAKSHKIDFDLESLCEGCSKILSVSVSFMVY
jgi:hypothetical protein